MSTLNYDKMDGLIPAIIQDVITKNVLMLGFMNEEAYLKTKEIGKVTFYSRTKNVYGLKAKKAAIFSM